jgi:hypothetical protein
LATAAEEAERHVLVIAAQEHRARRRARAPAEQQIDDAARVGAAVDVVADERDRVARDRRDRVEEPCELRHAAVDVADREQAWLSHARLA